MQESIDHDIFPENVRTFARNYYKQKKNLLLVNTNGVLCIKNPKSQRALHERPCMIVMPQLYQHEILFKAHDAMGHQGIAKVLARIQERHTWPGIRRTIGQYVSQCITCQQVRDKPGDVRFHLKNIQSGYLNELVQYDHLKICPSDDDNTGILVIIDHFSKLTEAVPCSHDDYDAATTSKLLLQKWFARHGSPTRMQSDNAPNFTAEVSAVFMKAAQVTKVTSTAGHPRTQGLVECQNRTLLTLLRVFCSRKLRDWDQYIDEVMGAYNSTRHATTGFSPYMLTRGMEKAIPLTFLYPKFATQSFESHEAYVDHVLARQQEIHDLARRNTHQAQQRQKLKYDRAIRAKAYEVGKTVWVFCRYIPQKGSPKLMRAWHGTRDASTYSTLVKKYTSSDSNHTMEARQSGLQFLPTTVKLLLLWILTQSNLMRKCQMMHHDPLIVRKNQYPKLAMHLCFPDKGTGWTPDYALVYVLAAVASTTNNTTIHQPSLTTNILMYSNQAVGTIPTRVLYYHH